jgi:hypothetical protein
MSFGRKYQIVFLLITSFICHGSSSTSSQITIAVLFNTGKSENSSATFSTAIKNSLEKIQSTLDSEAGVNFVYKDFNSTFCDLGTFLAFVDGRFACGIVVLLLENCQCEKMLISYLDALNVKTISSCESPFLIVSKYI